MTLLGESSLITAIRSTSTLGGVVMLRRILTFIAVLAVPSTQLIEAGVDLDFPLRSRIGRPSLAGRAPAERTKPSTALGRPQRATDPVGTAGSLQARLVPFPGSGYPSAPAPRPIKPRMPRGSLRSFLGSVGCSA
jgi:hypothetical protein